MEIHYKRELTKSMMYMESDYGWSAYEKELLSRRRVEGFLSMNVTRENGVSVCWYEITGMQALDGVLGAEPMRFELLSRLLAGLCGALEAAENHLLDASGILLEPECIYWNYETENCKFCYYPQTDGNIAVKFRKLTEFLLTKIDHRDDMAVKIAYQVYEQAGKEGFSLTALRGLLQFQAEEEAPPLAEKPSDRLPFMDVGSRVKKREETFPDEGNTVKKAASVKERLLAAVGEKQVKERLLKKFFPNLCGLKEWREVRKKKNAPEPIAFEPEEREIPAGRPTVLLADKNRCAYGIFRYEGNRGLSDLKVEETPYLIGSAAECAGRLDSPAVSRRHARVTKVGDIYFIEDMNSSNGTKVGGRLLDYKGKESLQPNEVVEFADEKFRFI